MARKNEDLIIIDTGSGALGVKERPIGHRGDTIDWRVRNTTGMDLKDITFKFKSSLIKANTIDIKAGKTGSVSVTVSSFAPNGVHKFIVSVNGKATVDPELEIQDVRLTTKSSLARKRKPALKKKTVRRK